VPSLDPVDLKVRRFFAVRSAYRPKWGRDDCILYISDTTGTPQLWRACPGRPHDLVLPWDERVGDYRVGPAGIVFASDVGGDEYWSLYLYDGERVELVAGEDGSVNLLGAWDPVGARLAYTSTARNGVDFDLYLYSPGAGRRLAARLEGMNSVAGWLGGERVIVVRRNTNLDTDILLVDPETGKAEVVTGHEGEALNASPRPYRGGIVYASNHGREHMALTLWEPGRGTRVLAEHPWDVELVEVYDGTVYYTVNEGGESVLYAWTPELGPREAWKAPGTLGSIDPGPGGVLASLSSPIMGVEVVLAVRRVAERVTRSPKAGVPEEALVYPEKLEYESFDGLRVPMLYYPPRDPAASPPPLVVWLHGGPESQERVRWNSFIQLFATLGIAVAAPNFRGSWGYGKSYVHLDDVEKRMDAVHDVYHAVKSLAEKGLADPGRACVMGGSYGGYLTLMALTQYPEEWRCGVSIVGIVNLVTFIRNTSPYRRRYRTTEYGDPDKHHDIMLQLSPITHIHRLQAPLMIVHGARDPRVPVSEAEQLVEALKERGVPVRYIRLEDEGHGLTKIENRIRVYTEAARFALQHLLGEKQD